MKEAFIKTDRFGFVTQVSCHLLLGRNSPAWDPNPRTVLTQESSKNTRRLVFRLTTFDNPPDSRCSGFPLLPPLHSTLGQLPASTNRAAGTPTNQSGAKICADQSEARVDTGQTIVLGSGCIPSKADLLEHHPITCPAQATRTVKGWTRCQKLKTALARKKGWGRG